MRHKGDVSSDLDGRRLLPVYERFPARSDRWTRTQESATFVEVPPYHGPLRRMFERCFSPSQSASARFQALRTLGARHDEVLLRTGCEVGAFNKV